MKQPALESLFQELKSSPSGLSTSEAGRRLAKAGPNEPVITRKDSVWRQLWRPFASPLVAVLLVASVLSAALGEAANAALVAAIVVISGLLSFFQSHQSQLAAEKLRAVIAPTAAALRDGAFKEIHRRDLVPGDVVRLGPGDLVPADVRLIEATGLHVQQAALTGESMPVGKEAAPDGLEVASEAEAPNRAFLGTSVVSGSGTALVTATGPSTMFGDIAARLATRRPETDFDRGIRELSIFITRVVFFLVLFVFIVSVSFHHNTMQSLLFAVALAVGLTPEFLPAITTITLSRGAVRMAKHQVIVKNLAAIENLGSIDVLCSDKTGTLTTGEMTLVDHVGPSGQKDDHVFTLAYLSSLHATDIDHPFTAPASVARGLNPLDAAIQVAGHPDVHSYTKVAEAPFDFERRRASLVVKQGDSCTMITVGAPESVIDVCSGSETSGVTAPWDAAARAAAETTFLGLSGKGYRVIAVAFRTVPHQNAYGPADEVGLTLAGFMSFVDPPREGAAEAVATMRRDGVEIKILTGDNDLVARHLCEQVGLTGADVVLGADLDRMGDDALAAVAERTTVFARVSPAQKNRIILALKRRSHVVGFLGDGINDAPSLHAADVGISVASATDVAKDAADIVLLQPGLDSLHSGIIEGRKAFSNVMKYLLMGVSSNFGNMLSMAGAAVFLPFLPMLPSQVLLNNFLYDCSQITIPTDDVDPDYVQKPRRWDLSIIRDFMVTIGPVSSLYDFLTFYVLLKVFHAQEALFHTGWFVESLATQTLVIFVIRTTANPLRSRPSRPLVATILAAICVGIALPYSPVSRMLGFTPLPAGFLLFLIVATATYLLLVQGAKQLLFRRAAAGMAAR
ncbi:MAG TPA: magnesium-translocating P-type ATPase [Armatimonadota bacterium]|jgi:Mg2+-importing ATPase